MMIKRNFRLLVLLVLLVSSSNVFSAPFYIVGYYTSWSGMDPAKIRYNLLTHINYAFVETDANGNISQIDSYDTLKIQNLVTHAHQNGVKVLVSFGGWDTDGLFNPMSSSQATRTQYTVNVLNFLNYFDLDGADIDWEFPQTYNDGETKCKLLMKELSDTLHNHNKLVTMAVAAMGANADIINSEIFGYVDFLTLMAYDNGTPHSSYGLAASSIGYWIDRGLPKEKTVLGVPFYGRGTGKSGTAYSVLYKNLVAKDPLAPYKNETKYVVNRDTFMCNYNGISVIKSKTQLAKTEANGIMIWDIAMDTEDQTSLLAAIYSASPATEVFDPSFESSVSLFPNPANSYINLHSEKLQEDEIVSASIIDFTGKEIYKLPIIINGDTRINVEGLTEGIYILKLSTSERTFQKKLVIKK